jgi:protocatechuate 3,4-dioxygenase alpha subunit
VTLRPTPSQTVGPFFTIGLGEPANEVVPGGPVRIEGRVVDGAGEGVSDALIETWQADEEGRYRGDFGWGRCGSDGEGRYSLVTAKPGSVEGQAPHLVVLVFARGLLKPVLTRMYFPDEAEANAADPVLAGLGDEERASLVAEPEGGVLRFDVRLQGDRPTVFFAL